jgi:hypothetical protein
MKPHHKIAIESLLTNACSAVDLLGKVQLGTIKEEDLKVYFGLKRACELVDRVVADLEQERLEEKLALRKPADARGAL